MPGQRQNPVVFPVWPSPNLWPDGHFECGVPVSSNESDPFGWWPSSADPRVGHIAKIGRWSAKFDHDASYAKVTSPVVGALPQAQYRITVWCHSDTTVDFNLHLRDQNTNWIASDSGVSCVADTWTRLSAAGTTGADDTGVRFQLEKVPSGQVTWHIDAIMLTRGSRIPPVYMPYNLHSPRDRVMSVRQRTTARVLK